MPRARIVHVRRHRQHPVQRPDRAGDEARLVRLLGGPAVGDLAGDARAGQVDVAHRALQPVVGLGDRGGREGVGLADVGAGGVILVVQVGDDVRPGEAQDVVVALQLAGVVGEALAADSRPRPGRAAGSSRPRSRRGPGCAPWTAASAGRRCGRLGSWALLTWGPSARPPAWRVGVEGRFDSAATRFCSSVGSMKGLGAPGAILAFLAARSNCSGCGARNTSALMVFSLAKVAAVVGDDAGMGGLRADQHVGGHRDAALVHDACRSCPPRPPGRSRWCSRRCGRRSCGRSASRRRG